MPTLPRQERPNPQHLQRERTTTDLKRTLQKKGVQTDCTSCLANDSM